MQDDLIVREWQKASGLDTARTTLIGFSQGAIMALESTQADGPPAVRVIALSGRFAQPPRVAPKATRVHLIHGDADRVMPVQPAQDALAQLQALGGPATLDRLPRLGHGIDSRVLGAIVGHMQDAHSLAS